MSSRPRAHLDISVRDRLLAIAKREGRDFNVILNLYYQERLLARLAASAYHDHFVLKGGLLLYALAIEGKQQFARPTKDIDLRGGGIGNDADGLRAIFANVCILDMPDGVSFDAAGVTAEHVAEDAMYHGVRLHIPVSLAQARGRIRVDIGFGDVITPGPWEMTLPVLLPDISAPRLLVYSLETVVAEKFEAMLSLSLINTRMKDFFDVYQLASAYSFDGAVLVEAIRGTCGRRGTPFTPDPPVLQEPFGLDLTRQRQWDAFLTRGRLVGSPRRLQDVMRLLRAFLGPLYAACLTDIAFSARWSPSDLH